MWNLETSSTVKMYDDAVQNAKINTKIMDPLKAREKLVEVAELTENFLCTAIGMHYTSRDEKDKEISDGARGHSNAMQECAIKLLEILKEK